MNNRGGRPVIRRGTPIKRGIGTPVNRGGLQRPKMHINISSSSESYEGVNDDIPMVNAGNKKQPKAAFLSSDDSYETLDNPITQHTKSIAKLESVSYSYSDSYYQQESLDPSESSSTNKNQPPQEIPVRRHLLRQKNIPDEQHEDEHKSNSNVHRTNRRLISDPSQKSQEKRNNNQLETSEGNHNAITQSNSSQNINNHENINIRLSKSVDENHKVNIQLNSDQPLSSNTNLNEEKITQNASSKDFENFIENNYNAESQNKPTASKQNDQPNIKLTFLREKGTLLKKETYSLLKDHKIVYLSSESKDNIGHFSVVSTQHLVTLELSYQGMVRRNSKNNKFLFISNETKLHDDREGEICGMFFKTQNVGKMKTKTLSLALTADNKPYFSISKRLSLSSVASGETTDVPNVITFRSKLPEINEKGKLSLNLGDVCLVPSCKNMIITDDNGEIIFSFYKINEGSFSVHCAPPITPLIAFTICIAIAKAM